MRNVYDLYFIAWDLASACCVMGVQGSFTVLNHAFELKKSIVPRLSMSQITLLGTDVKKSDVRVHILGPLSTQIVFVGVLGP